jgi:hypothetical protein
MNLACHSDWKCSLERIDPEKGYIPENVVLCCNEFNGSFQWSMEKVKIIPTLLQKPEMQCCDSELLALKINQCSLILKCGLNAGKICSEVHDFCSHPIELIKNADASLTTAAILVREKLQILLCSARSTTKKKIAKQSKAKQLNMTITLTFNELIAQYIKQQGKCAYSGIQFNMEAHSDWVISLERINTRIGYQASNVVLICREFNTCDISALSGDPDNCGSCAWSKEKFHYFLQHKFPDLALIAEQSAATQ